MLDFSMVKGDGSSREEVDGGGDGGTQACIVAWWPGNSSVGND